MKNKCFKIIYVFLIIFGIFSVFFLLIHPLKKTVQYVHFNVKNKVYSETFDSKLEQDFEIVEDGTFRILFFLNYETTYDNLNIKMLDSDNNVIFDNQVEEYSASSMYFEFTPLDVGNYKLIIEDLDGDSLELITSKATKEASLKNDNSRTLKFVTYYRDNYYFYLWYPVFLFAFLFTIYPFIWGDMNEKK